MLTAQGCYHQSKTGWDYVTKITADPLTEYLLILGEIKNYGNMAYFPPFIRKVNKNLTVYLDGEVYVARDEYNVFYQAFKKDLKKFSQHISFIHKKYFSSLLKTAKRIFSDSRDLFGYSNKELIKLFEKYLAEFQRTGAIISSPFSADWALAELLKERLLKQDLDNNKINTLIFHLSVPKKISQAAGEKKELKKIVKIIKRNQKLREIFITKDAKEIIYNLKKYHLDIFKQIKKHQQKYAWLGFTFFNGRPLDFEYFIDRLINNLNSAEQERRPKDKMKFSFILTPPLKALAKTLQEVCYLRTWRIEMSNQATYFIYPLLAEIAKRLRLNYNQLIQLTKPEIKDALLERKHYLPVIKQRQKGFGVVFDKNFKIHVITGKPLKAFQKYFGQEIDNVLNEDITGIGVQIGKTKGRVCIINNTKEFKKFREGDILITQMTTPNFMLIIEKAKAIITDIGGITCHAAIIARELKIPCVVGTKFATKVLRDGDKVEVDANKGIVRIVK